MVEVVGDALVDLDEGQPEPLARVQLGAAVPRGRPRRPAGSAASASSRSKTRRPTPARTPASRGPSAAKSVSLPRRASEPTSVNRSVRSIDVHAGVRGEELREPVAVAHPEGHVVEGLDLHRPERTHLLFVSNAGAFLRIPAPGGRAA